MSTKKNIRSNSTSAKNKSAPYAAISSSDKRFLLKHQKLAFTYFSKETKSIHGLTRDSSRKDSPCSIAGIGFRMTALLVAVERKHLSRSNARSRALESLHFLTNSHQGAERDATGRWGFFYHFLDCTEGKRMWKSELSTIDTALLMIGVLAVQTYFDRDEKADREVRDLADALFRNVEWTKMLSESGAIKHGWKPENGFLKWEWRGYNEALLLYILALGSPTHPIPSESYEEWLKGYQWKKYYGLEYIYAGPLFVHQFPQCWLDLRGIHDDYVRRKGIDYFENSARATNIQSLYCEKNSRGFKEYSRLCWGLTACDGPAQPMRSVKNKNGKFFNYIARGVPSGPDDGTLAPWAAIASLPFAPHLVLETLRQFQSMKLGNHLEYGFETTFNPSFEEGDSMWVSDVHYAINQGPIILMIENYLTGFVWDLMKRSPYVVIGLKRAGFEGGWLDELS